MATVPSSVSVTAGRYWPKGRLSEVSGQGATQFLGVFFERIENPFDLSRIRPAERVKASGRNSRL